jgi:hypothetical protein
MLLTLAQRARAAADPGTARRPSYTGGQHELVYLVTSLRAVTAAGLDWCLYDGHATDPFSQCLVGPPRRPASTGRS